jgi:hypothetical protein
MINKTKSTDKVVGSVFKNDFHKEGARGGGTFHFVCYDKDGNLKWKDSAKNIVVNTGLQDMNTKYFKGSSYTAAWYIGLVSDSGFVGYNATDTLASHSDWTETTVYSGGNRITAVFGTATTAAPSVINNAVATGGTVAVFSITGTVTVKGAFLTNIQDKTDNTGLLFSVSNFTGGDRSVVSGDTLNVTYEFSLDDA